MTPWSCHDCLRRLDSAGELRIRIEGGRLLCLCPEHERLRRQHADFNRRSRFPLALVLVFLTCAAGGGIAFLTEYVR